jgi:two-component system probable response regulator PhcQ
MAASGALPRVLVVDDEPANLNTFRRAFRKDLAVSVAHSGAEAVAALQAQRFDIVFVDFAMPHMNGLEVLEHARRIQPGAMRVLLTAYSERPELHRAVKRGLAVALLRKPWNRAEILESVGRAITERTTGAEA